MTHGWVVEQFPKQVLRLGEFWWPSTYSDGSQPSSNLVMGFSGKFWRSFVQRLWYWGSDFGAKNSFVVFLKSICSQGKVLKCNGLMACGWRSWRLFSWVTKKKGSTEGVDLGLWIRRFEVGMILMAALWARHHCLMGWDKVDVSACLLTLKLYVARMGGGPPLFSPRSVELMKGTAAHSFETTCTPIN